MVQQEQNVTFGVQPVYAAGANYDQAAVRWAINRAYCKLIDDLADITLVSKTLNFASVAGQFAYPVPIGESATGTLTTKIGTGTITGVVLTTTINGTAVTYTCVAGDGALSALQGLVTKVNANTTLVVASSPVINPVQQALNASSQFTVSAFTAGTAGNAITFTASSSNSAIISLTASAATLTGGTAQSPSIRKVRSIYYQPLGLTYNLRRAPGVRLVSWDEYQRKTADGYMQYFSAGQQPDYVAMDTQRANLYLYGTPFTSGDTIGLQYAPQITNSANVPATNWGYLTAGTDSPPSALPEDANDCIWMWASFLLWPKSREIGTGLTYDQIYDKKKNEVIANYMDASTGASFGIRAKEDLLADSFGWR